MSPAALRRGRLPDLALPDAGRLLPLPLGRRRPLRLDQIPGDAGCFIADSHTNTPSRAETSCPTIINLPNLSFLSRSSRIM